MRINKNQFDSKCPLCGEVMRKGELGTNYSPYVGFIHRGHVHCVKTLVEKKQKEKYASR